MVWDVLQDCAQSMQETTLNGAYSRMVKHGHKMTLLQTLSNAKFDIAMSKSSSRWSNWTFGSPNSESRRKSYVNHKFRTRVLQRLQAGRPHLGRPAWHWLLSALLCTNVSTDDCVFLLELVWVLILSLVTLEAHWRDIWGLSVIVSLLACLPCVRGPLVSP